jgi:hypothetical protein
MVKKIVIAVLFTAVIVLAVIQYNYIKGSSEELSSYSRKAMDQASGGDMEAAHKTIDELKEHWQQEQHLYQALMEHSESDKISISLEKSLEFAEYKDQTQFVAEAAALNFLLEHIHEIDKLTLENVF